MNRTLLVDFGSALSGVLSETLNGAGQTVAVVACPTELVSVGQALDGVDQVVICIGVEECADQWSQVKFSLRRVFVSVLATVQEWTFNQVAGRLVIAVEGDGLTLTAALLAPAVAALSRTLAQEYGMHGIRSNVVSWEGNAAAAAMLVQFLLSEDSSFVTGAVWQSS
jgi:hypothetical protein